MNDKAYVIAGSHRARAKLHSLVGDGNHSEYYNFQFKYHLTEIPGQFLNKALEITGVRKGNLKAKEEFKWYKCWSNSKEIIC